MTSFQKVLLLLQSPYSKDVHQKKVRLSESVCVCSQGGLSGLVMGFVATLSVGLGDLIFHSSPEMTRPLPLTTEGCNLTIAEDQNRTSTVLPTETSVITTTLGLISEDM